MTPLVSLWLPILLSAVGVFLASSALHMFTGLAQKRLPQGAERRPAVMDTLRPLAIPPGDYMMPRPDSTEQMRSPAFVEKFKKGPVMMSRSCRAARWRWESSSRNGSSSRWWWGASRRWSRKRAAPRRK